MPKIAFVKTKAYASIEAPEGSLLMKVLLQHQRPVASSCLGKGVCSKCKVAVLAGQENLSPETAAERDLRQRNQIPEGFRISCQTHLLGDITVDTDYW